jgi:hypothetical protein
MAQSPTHGSGEFRITKGGYGNKRGEIQILQYLAYDSKVTQGYRFMNIKAQSGSLRYPTPIDLLANPSELTRCDFA